jgi:hypothetical protein
LVHLDQQQPAPEFIRRTDSSTMLADMACGGMIWVNNRHRGRDVPVGASGCGRVCRIGVYLYGPAAGVVASTAIAAHGIRALMARATGFVAITRASAP